MRSSWFLDLHLSSPVTNSSQACSLTAPGLSRMGALGLWGTVVSALHGGTSSSRSPKHSVGLGTCHICATQGQLSLAGVIQECPVWKDEN